ncbi:MULTISPECIES: hypothetical protein [unclassified Acidovorax]|uniref:hypothetical protein n=1 Tax=unclassified Acidovorax TaxID=2684926 RepID=UPI0023DE1F88|nr:MULTISPECIES: hypothetical protein [unclassified Acidovorax]GKS90497.1 hypothetical protein AVTE2539_14050 [Acidovorax sp. SUPP2539]GKT00122.1 hypothetical protein AVKW3434_12055 [Acidovorax sp. SUPP3434]
MPSTSHPSHRPLPGPARVRRAWAWGAAGAVLLAAVFLLYAEPDFVVMMADQLWACF